MCRLMASSSRLYHQLASFHLLNWRNPTNLNLISKKISFLSSPSSPSSSPLLLKPFSSSSVSFDVTADDNDASALFQSPPPAAAAATAAHAWPEWDQFVDKMRSKGYFAKTQLDDVATASAAVPSSSYSPAAMDQNRIKNACLAFARERYDIIKSLPKADIQAIVECGCPNLYRKAVNSAKRLRAFLGLDEGDVCGACNLRGSCDRAYVIEKDNDKARTVDIVRILMSYAVDPTLQSGGTNPSITDAGQESARKLLRELIKLSDATMDPNLPKPEVQPTSKKESYEKSQSTSKSKHSEVTNMSKHSQNVEMKRGDWMCSNCNFLNFARNVRCLECKADGPKRVDFASAEMKLGDWTCLKCEFMNFARNKKCFRCLEARPKRELNPGEWECPRCDFLNFRRNTVCKKCNGQRPTDNENSGFEHHSWKNHKMSRDTNTVLNFGGDEDEKEDADDDDKSDDILPAEYEEDTFVASKRAAPAEKRANSARKQNDNFL